MRNLIAALALGLAALLAAAPAQAELSANIGWVNKYIFRGVPQKTGGSFSAGLDYDRNGFYVGTWAADVGDGAEVDLYAGYEWELESGWTFNLGGYGYFYTGDFDDTYYEAIASASYGIVSFEAVQGRYDNFGGPKEYYRFASLGIEHEGWHLSYGRFFQDASGDYVEGGYGFDLKGWDIGLSAVWSSKDLAGNDGRSDTAFVFSIGRSFTLIP